MWDYLPAPMARRRFALEHYHAKWYEPYLLDQVDEAQINQPKSDHSNLNIYNTHTLTNNMAVKYINEAYLDEYLHLCNMKTRINTKYFEKSITDRRGFKRLESLPGTSKLPWPYSCAPAWNV